MQTTVDEPSQRQQPGSAAVPGSGVLILLVLVMHVRTLIKEYKAHLPEEDHEIHDTQLR